MGWVGVCSREPFLPWAQPGGSLFLSTINRTMKSYALAIVGAEYILGWVPPGTHQWNKFVQPTELGVLLQRCVVAFSPPPHGC